MILTPCAVTSPALTLCFLNKLSSPSPSWSSPLSLDSSHGPLSPGLSLSQLLDEMREDQEHQGALVCLAESCLTLEGPCTAPPVTHWAASRCKATVSLGICLGDVRVRSWARVIFHRT